MLPVVSASDSAAVISGDHVSAYRSGEISVIFSLDRSLIVQSGRIDVSYDENVLTLKTITWCGDLENATLNPTYPKKNYCIFAFEYATAVSGDLVKFTFDVASDAQFAETEVALSRVTLNTADDEGVHVVEKVNGSVTVTCNHDFSLSAVDEKYFVKDATCTAPKLYYKSCSICGAAGTDTFTVGEANGHKGGTATCIAQAVCTVCSESYGKFAEHDYTAETVKDEALKSAGTCKDEAVYRYSCSVCGKVESDNDTHTFKGEKDPSNHVGGTKTVNYSAAVHKTQTAGYTGDTQCLGCENIIANGKTIEPTPHVAAEKWTTDADSHWKLCSVDGCGVEIEDSRVAHVYDSVCDVDCNVCGEVRTAPHDYAEDWTSDYENHWHKCKLCDSITGVAEHNFVDGKCDVCGHLNYIPGDVNGDLTVDYKDALYLVRKIAFGDSKYPINQPADFNKDGRLTSLDAVYLLKAILFGFDEYPLI